MKKPNLLAFSIVLLWTASPAIHAQGKWDKFEIAQQFSLLLDRDRISDTQITDPGNVRLTSRKNLMGTGVAFTYFPLRFVGLDSEYTFYAKNFFLQPKPGASVNWGGYDLPPFYVDYRKANYSGPAHIALFGIKAGIRTKKVGVFIKARPGFADFHPANDCVPVVDNGRYTSVKWQDQCSEKRMKNLAMDLGGVAELYLPHRTFVRFDAGDTYLRYGKTTMVFSGYEPQWINYTYGEDNRHHFQLKLGFGARF
jgi:hypothetical protein